FTGWESARARSFPVPLSNRYLEFHLQNDNSLLHRLNFKYEAVFPELQKAFVRLQLQSLLGDEYINDTATDGMHNVTIDPRMLYSMWAIDPNAATLFGLKYADVPGRHSPTA